MSETKHKTMLISRSSGAAYLLSVNLAVHGDDGTTSLNDANPVFYVTYPGGPILGHRFRDILLTYETFFAIQADPPMKEWFDHQVSRLDVDGQVIKID